MNTSHERRLALQQNPDILKGILRGIEKEGLRVDALGQLAKTPHPRAIGSALTNAHITTDYAEALLELITEPQARVEDVFVNAVGGVKITEPAADLAVLLAILSSLNNRPLPRGLVVFGEIGLAGEIRPAPRGQERLREAAKLGFSIALIPKSNAPRQPVEGLEIWAVDRVEDAVDRLRNL